MKIKVNFPMTLEYGFGPYGLESYLYLWDDVILFIKEESDESPPDHTINSKPND